MRHALVAVATGTLALGASTLGAGAAAAASPVFNPDAMTITGSADGASGNITVTAGGHHSKVTIPEVAPQSLSTGCSQNVDGKSNEKTLSNVHFGSAPDVVLTATTVEDSGVEQLNDTTIGITEESNIEDVSALGGVITADALDTVAHTTDSAAGLDNHTGAGEPAPSTLVVANLNVAGHVFNGVVPPNTKVTISNGNYVVINEQKPTSDGIVVNGLDIHVSALGAFSGTALVAHATSLVKSESTAAVSDSGDAFAASLDAQAATLSVHTGQIAPASIGCKGGNATNSIADIDLGLPNGTGVATSGTGIASVSSSSSPAPTVSSSEDLENLNLLSGLVTADALHVTSTSAAAGALVTSTGTTTFTNLVVAGQPITANPAPNTQIALAGLGTLTLNKETCSSGPVTACVAGGHEHLTVTALSLDVNADNSWGLPLSTNVTIAQAASGITT
jgi:hypothetical protein